MKTHTSSYSQGKQVMDYILITDREVCINCSIEILPGSELYIGTDPSGENYPFIFHEQNCAAEWGEIHNRDFNPLEKRLLIKE